jgi:hypothetical protein
MYFITFTRKMGAGASQIARSVATQLETTVLPDKSNQA